MARQLKEIVVKPCPNPDCRFHHEERQVGLKAISVGLGLFSVGTVVCECGYHMDTVYVYGP